ENFIKDSILTYRWTSSQGETTTEYFNKKGKQWRAKKSVYDKESRVSKNYTYGKKKLKRLEIWKYDENKKIILEEVYHGKKQ
ncbi:MAG: hypothetical protein V4622_13915, partial [Bacteroidota bacterium]